MTMPRRSTRDMSMLLAELYDAGTPDYRDDLVQRIAASPLCQVYRARHELLDKAVERGKLTAEKKEQILARIIPTADAQLNRYFSLEGGYVDFGKLESDGVGRDLEANSVYLTAVGSVPFTDKFSGYAKAGFQRWDLDTPIAATGTRDDSGTDPTYGVGVQYRFTDAFALRGEYSRFEVEDADLDLAQVQVQYNF